MSAPAADDGLEAPRPTVDDRPTTGLPAVDDALGRLADLGQRPVSEHHGELAAAHETLHAELESPSGSPEGH
ncbi:hypothetical protein GCM10022204_35230 [Microlunatus aurantiacus]|uniref:Uncharacterized protein n=1 Tax=Microlunatus aurantiacus TaxID=446786 RepID=A0ABP7E2E3_9ACTN